MRCSLVNSGGRSYQAFRRRDCCVAVRRHCAGAGPHLEDRCSRERSSWPPLEGLRDGLRDLGYVEGKTHLFVYRFAQGRAERFPALASELVDLPVDVIVSWGTPASLAAHKATATIPIVISAGDPVGAGIVASLARPGGNVTGMSVQMAEQEGKRLELLKKLLPSFSRVAVLSNPSNPVVTVRDPFSRCSDPAIKSFFTSIFGSNLVRDFIEPIFRSLGNGTRSRPG